MRVSAPLPEELSGLFEAAEKAGAGIAIWDRDDVCVAFNDVHRLWYDVVDFSAPRITYRDLATRFLERGRLDSQHVYLDPEGWIQHAVNFRWTTPQFRQVIRHVAPGGSRVLLAHNITYGREWHASTRLDVTSRFPLLLHGAIKDGASILDTLAGVPPNPDLGEDAPSAVVDAKARIITANRAMLALTDAGDGLTIVDGYLRATEGSKDNFHLCTSIRGAEAGTPVQTISIDRPEERRPFAVRVSALDPEEGWSTWGAAPGAARIKVFDPLERPRIEPALFARHYGLSAAEVEILRELISGATPQEISKRKKRSIGTVRAQLSAMYSKTGTARQAELVAVAISFALKMQG